MKTQLTIIGLGQIGTSVGMALNKYKDQIIRIGHDKHRVIGNRAKDLDAVDKITLTLSGSVKDADIVLIALPFHEIYPVLEHISQDLKEHALVIDTGPIKQPVLKWAEELLPDNRYYVGLTPVINYEYLDEFEFGQDTAQPDLFSNCLMGVVSGQRANDEALNLALNLVQLLGASPYFCDAAEIDGLMTMTHIMPQLLAAALLKTSQDTPGWREARKIAGKTYTHVTNPLVQDDSPGALAASIIYNQENTTRVLNDLIRTLVEIRDLSSTPGQVELEALFSKLQSDRDLWLLNRKESRWIDSKKIDIPRGGIMSQLLGIRKPRPPKDQKDD